MDKGPWVLSYRREGELQGVASDDFKHDVTLYVKAHSEREYLRWINENASSFSLSINEPQVEWNYALTLFTVASQHVRGNSVEECIDSAMIMAEGIKRGWRHLAWHNNPNNLWHNDK